MIINLIIIMCIIFIIQDNGTMVQDNNTMVQDNGTMVQNNGTMVQDKIDHNNTKIKGNRRNRPIEPIYIEPVEPVPEASSFILFCLGLIILLRFNKC